MDFTGRGSQPAQPANNGAQFGGATNGGTKKTKGGKRTDKLVKVGAGIFGLLLVALVAFLLINIGFGKKTEAQYIDDTKLQAVFLQTGQVYFGKINPSSVTGNSFVLNDIYYLQTSSTGTGTQQQQQTANTNVSLVKLGCELHAPRDQMVINRDQVTFWENLNDDGQVAKAVATFQKDNPNGQKCQDQSAAPNTNSNVQNAGTTNTTNNSGATTNR